MLIEWSAYWSERYRISRSNTFCLFGKKGHSRNLKNKQGRVVHLKK